MRSLALQVGEDGVASLLEQTLAEEEAAPICSRNLSFSHDAVGPFCCGYARKRGPSQSAQSLTANSNRRTPLGDRWAGFMISGF